MARGLKANTCMMRKTGMGNTIGRMGKLIKENSVPDSKFSPPIKKILAIS